MTDLPFAPGLSAPSERVGVSAGQPVGRRSVNFLACVRLRRAADAFAGDPGAGAAKAGLPKVPPAPEPLGLALPPFAGEGPSVCFFGCVRELRTFFVPVGMTLSGSIAASSRLARPWRLGCFVFGAWIA